MNKLSLTILSAAALLTAADSFASPIKVAVFQDSNNGSADASGHVANQLNDDTWFDFDATIITAGTSLDTLAELSSYDAVIIGDDGYGQSRDDWNLMGSALKSWVSGGGALVTTAWTTYWNDLNADIKDIMPVYGAGQYSNTTVLDVTNSSHAITLGVNDFISPAYQNFGTAKVGATVLGIAGANSNAAAIATWDYGLGRVVSLSPQYMGSRSAYGSALNNLESGDADRLLEQSLAYAADATSVPEPATFALIGLGLIGLGFGRKKQA